MKTISSSSSLSFHHEPSSHYDELTMQQSLLFSDSLKELKNLRSQLYSAAEYFELSYTNDEHKQIVVDTLKDYTVKALVNTVDHLGSVSYKVNGMLDGRVIEVLGTELRVSRIEQRLRACQKHIDYEGVSQQSMAIATPKHHKRYLLPVGETMRISSRPLSANQCCSLDDEDHWHQFKNAVRSTIRETPSSSFRKGQAPSPSPQRSRHGIGVFSFTEKQTIPEKRQEKRTISPSRARYPLTRSGSFSSRTTSPLASRSTTPISSRSRTPTSSRPTTPSSPNMRHRNSMDGWKSASMRLHSERDNPKDLERQPSKSKRLLKALLSRGKSTKDEGLYTFLDEY